MYGPEKLDKMSTRAYYFHELCATWCPEIYLGKTNKLLGLKEGIKRALKTRCSWCQEFGGVLGCTVEECLNTYHFLCAVSTRGNNDEQSLFRDDFHMYCPNHRHLATQEEIDNQILQ